MNQFILLYSHIKVKCVCVWWFIDGNKTVASRVILFSHWKEAITLIFAFPHTDKTKKGGFWARKLDLIVQINKSYIGVRRSRF